MTDRLASPRPYVFALATPHGEPADLDLECGIISAVLTGTVTPGELAIAADDFYATVNRLLWPELLAAPDPTDVPAVVAASEIHGPLLEELETLRDGQPFFVPARVKVACARVRELARQRRLIAVLQSIDAQLRIGCLDVKGARARLSEFFKGAA